MPLPAELRPPLNMALARPVHGMPAADALPGGSRFEPKFDGFRIAAYVDDSVTLWSRQGKDLTRAFPDLLATMDTQLPDGLILDGEVVVWKDGHLDFDALLRRLNAGNAALARMVREQPASYVAFDVLAVAGRDTRHLRFDDRRALLEQLSGTMTPPLNLSPVTEDAAEAAEWFESLPATGIEGLVVKSGSQSYLADRSWLKVEHRNTLDIICAAVIGPRNRPSELVLGLPVDGRLRIVGRSAPLAAQMSRDLGGLLEAPGDTHPWPTEVKPGAVDRFNRGGRDTVHLTLVRPMVVEISADVAMSGSSFRHAVRFLRARPEVPLTEIDLDPWPR